ncbi:MAG: ATP-binding protein, partial [Alphaproteobacteria bacterium]|nr:ATP-binding protein [Alphaproteobacteria bacterium]
MTNKSKFHLMAGLLFGLGAVMVAQLAMDLFDPSQRYFYSSILFISLDRSTRILLIFSILWFGTVFGLIVTWMLIRHHFARPITQLTLLLRQIRLDAGNKSANFLIGREIDRIESHSSEIATLLNEIKKLQNRIDAYFIEKASDLQRVEASYNAQAQFLLSSGQNLWQQLNHIAQLAESMAFGAGSLSATQYRAYCGEIKNVTQNLAQLALAMSEISREQSRDMILHEEGINLNQLLADKIREFDVTLRGSGILLVVKIPPNLPWLRADATRIRHIFENLLDNARKFTLPGGTIKLAVFENSMRKIEIIIEDDGIGMSEIDTERILFPDRLGGMEANYAPPESRILLSLVKRLVEAHGASMKLDSQ